jgi:hypothetical protein
MLVSSNCGDVDLPPLPQRSRSANGDLLSPKKDEPAAAQRHRAWVLSLNRDFNQRVSLASLSSELDAPEELGMRQMSHKRGSIDLSSWDAEGYGMSDAGSDLGGADDEPATTLRVALGLQDDRLVRAAMGLPPHVPFAPLCATVMMPEKRRSISGKGTPPRRRSSMAPTYRGSHLQAAECVVREEWVATPLPPLLHRQSMPDLNRFVKQKTG